MPKLSLRVLGGFDAKLDGDSVASFRSDKERTLLAYLAVESDRPHRREELAALLWGDLPEDAALNNLRKSLHHLRQVLGDSDSANPFLIVSSKTIAFNLQSDQSLDVTTFASAIQQMQAHSHRRAETCLRCQSWLIQAVNLYKGDLLQGFNLPDAVAFDEWMLVKREQLRQQMLIGLQRLTDIFERRGEYGPAQRYARQQAALEPWREVAHRQLMTVLARSGQRAAALAQFEVCRKALHAELGVEPEAATLALYEQIKRGDSWDPTPKATLNLPAQTTPFLGRALELQRLRAWLQDPHLRLITLTGPGGMGKTRLALQAGFDLAFEFTDGIYFVPLAALRDPALVAATIAQSLGVTSHGAQSIEEILEAYLSPREILIILDNYEHLLPSANLLAQLLAACPRLTLLVTSREPLRLRGEQLYPVPPLDLPTPADLQATPAPEGLLHFGAVGLFVQQARAIQPDFALTSAEATTIVEVCRRLDGLPLAIELAAARVNLMAPSAMLTQLDKAANTALHFLTEGARDLPARQQTMRATIAWSYDLLTPPEQQLCQRLSVFLGGALLPAIESVTPAGFDVPLTTLLESLCDKNLIQKTASDPVRFTMLETIREFAWDALQHAGALTATRHAHAQYFLQWAESIDPHLNGPDQGQWLTVLENDHDNLRATLTWALESQSTETAQRLAGSLWRFWDVHGHVPEGRRWLEQALAPAAITPPPVRAKALNGLGMLLWYQGDFDQSRATFTEALNIRRALNDSYGLAISLNNLGMVNWSLGNYDRALDLYAECLKFDQANNDVMGQGFSYGNLGLVYHHQGDFEKAHYYFEQSRVIFQQEGNRRHEAFAQHNLAMVCYQQGNYAQARALYTESLRTKEEISDKWGIATTLVYLANVTLAEGDFPQTRQLLTRALQLHEELGDRPRLAAVFDGLAALAVAEAQPQKAVQLFAVADQLRRTSAAHLHATDKLNRDRNLDPLRTQLPTPQFDSLWSTGQSLPLDAALKLALEK